MPAGQLSGQPRKIKATAGKLTSHPFNPETGPKNRHSRLSHTHIGNDIGLVSVFLQDVSQGQTGLFRKHPNAFRLRSRRQTTSECGQKTVGWFK